MGQGIVEGLLGSADRAGGDVDAPAIERLHGELEPFPLLPQPVTGGDAHGAEVHLPGGLAVPAHLLLRLAVTHAGGLGRYHEGGDPLRPLAAGAGHHHQHIGAAGARDEHLAAVDDVILAIAHGAGLEGRGIGSGARLGEAVGAQQLAAGEPWHPLLGHLGRQPAAQHPAHHVVDGQIGGGGGAAHGEALEDEAGIEPWQAEAAVLLWGVEATKAKRRRLLDGRDGELMLLVPARGVGLERLLGEGAGGLHIGLLIRGQRKIHLVRFLVLVRSVSVSECVRAT